MSMARSTPAQKPRGPASRISEIGDFMRSSLEEEGYPEYAHVVLQTAVRRAGMAVGDVLVPVAGVDRGAIGHEVLGADATVEHEREVRADLGDLQVRPAGEGGQLDVGHEAPEAQEMVAVRPAQTGKVVLLGADVLLVERLEADL